MLILSAEDPGAGSSAAGFYTRAASQRRDATSALIKAGRLGAAGPGDAGPADEHSVASGALLRQLALARLELGRLLGRPGCAARDQGDGEQQDRPPDSGHE